MKLKNLLFSAFLILTFIPTVIVTGLLYNSGIQLSKESYIKNLTESITVQADYISETLKNNMLNEQRFATKTILYLSDDQYTAQTLNDTLYEAFQSYLEASQDTLSMSLLLNKTNTPIYTIGEKSSLQIIQDQLPALSATKQQTITEVHLGDGVYSLGIVTPIYQNGTYSGCLISIYDKTYIYKIISSYYELSDTTTYICRNNGEVVNFHNSNTEEPLRNAIQNEMQKTAHTSEGTIRVKNNQVNFSGFYKSIYNSPWYLTGLVNDQQVFAFANQFIWIYIFIVACIIIADILLSFYISHRVVAPINHLIKVMDDYPNSMENGALREKKKKGYVETQYLWIRFISLMKKILLIQHNFEGIFQLYHSSIMDDINIDIDVEKQTVHSNKDTFDTLMQNLEVPEGACIVERFTRCFCDKDQQHLMHMLEQMRDKHLSVTKEDDVFTPFLGGKWFHSLIVPMYEDERLSRLFIQLRDVSSFKKQELESREKAKRDHLTNLYNRAGFMDKVKAILSMSDKQTMHGIFFIDMNNFKLVNDTFGHKTGDELLKSVSNQLQKTFHTGCIISRFGGDEFAVFMPNTNKIEVQKMADITTESLIYPYQHEHHSFIISASVGFTVGDTTLELESLLDQADSNMYKKKREMKHHIVE